MIFSTIPTGASVFLDANTFVYHFAPDPAYKNACTDLLIRIKRQEIEGLTSTHVLAEMAHRLMTLEVIQRLGLAAAGIGYWLRKNPAEVQKFMIFRQAIQEIPVLGVRVLSVSPDLLDSGAAISQSAGLLTNDALVVAVMQANGLAHLASNDGDFDRVPGITRYSPI